MSDSNERVKGGDIPPSPGFSIDYMDRSVGPDTDFFNFVAGNWVKKNPVPADKSSWGSFMELRERNLYLLHEILEKCASAPEPDNGKKKQLGDFYKSAMNTEQINRLAFTPIKVDMEEISRIKDMGQVMEEITRLHKKGVPALFSSYSDGDKKNSSIYALYLWQGGLSLPSKDYYFSDHFTDVRKHFVDHVSRMFSLLGRPEGESSKNASTVMRIETKLAELSRFPADLRDDEKNYHKTSMKELEENYKPLNLHSYFSTLEVPGIDHVIVGQPEFYEGITKLLHEVSVDDWKTYLEWNVIRSAAPFLHEEVEMESFDFFHRKLMGQQEPEPRWKRILGIVDALIGESLGELYVREHFGKEAEENMKRMVDDIKSVFADRLTKLTWMTDETKKKALSKFERFRTKIGHPEKYRDYSSISVSDTDYFGNVNRAAQFEVMRQMHRAGEAVDRKEWFMTPPTVNAYFSPTDNEIVFPAGILQPPFFDVSMDPAVNYGGIGAVISHEITHGYDDQGRHFDLEGNLSDWWTKEDEEAFNKKAKAVSELYGSLEVLPGVKVNGELTLGENIADFGGVSIAYEALQRRLTRNPELRVDRDGFTPEQRFFISWGQVWRSNIRDQEAKRRVTIDPHAPGKFRATVPPQNHPDFETAFGIEDAHAADGSRREKIPIW